MKHPTKERFLFLISEATKIGDYQKAHDLKIALEIYVLSEKLDIHDWKKIRTFQFWEQNDKLNETEQKDFLINAIKVYLENKKRIALLLNK